MMEIRFTFKALVVGRYENVGKDGKTYYNIALVIDGKSGNVSCTKDVYDRVAPMKENVFMAMYSLQWNRFSILSLAN